MKKHLLKFLLAIFLFAGWQSSYGQVFITELADPNNASGARYVELYNYGSTNIDLSAGWQLVRYTNDNLDPQSPVDLTGTIDAHGFFIICANQTTFTATFGFAADQNIGTGGPADSNGDDQIYLVNPSGDIVDFFGVPGEDGSGTDHEFEDGRAERQDTVTVGKTTYNSGEWNIDNDSGGGAGAQDAPGTFDPGDWIGYTDTYTPVAIFNPEDGATNHSIADPIILTFNEEIRAAADGSTFDNTTVAGIVTLTENVSGNPVIFTTTINATNDTVIIIPSSPLTSELAYDVAINDFEDVVGNETTGQNITFTATNKAVGVTAPAAESVYYAGDPVTVTWTSANITTVDINLWTPSSSSWVSVATGITAADGTKDITIPAASHYSTEYKVRVVDADNAVINAESSEFRVKAVAGDIATLRTYSDGDTAKLTGKAVISLQAASRNQKFIQDLTAGILIDDNSGTITTVYAVSDSINGFEGKVSSFGGMMQFVPAEDPGVAINSGNTITPQEITVAEFKTNFDNYESEVIKLVDVRFIDADGTGSFAKTNYDLADANDTTEFRPNFDDLDYIGNTVPHKSIENTLVGVAIEDWGTAQLCSRNAADIIVPDYIVITSIGVDSTFDTEENVTVDFVTYNQTDLLKLQVWVDDATWVDIETDIDPASGTVTTQVSADAAEASTYKLRLTDQTDALPLSNEVPFSINDITGPVWNTYLPKDDSIGVARNSNLAIDFNELIQAGTGNIIIKQYNSDAAVATYDIADGAINITGTTLTLTHPTEWPNDSMLYVEIAAGVIVDMQGNDQFSIAKDDWNFTIADEIAPVATFSPLDAATGIAKNAALTISFDQAIYTIAGGATTFTNTTIDDIITLKLTDNAGADVAFDATINLTNDVITITPDANFNGLTVYYYAISDQYTDDADNQGAAGNASFTTIDDAAPVVTITPTSGASDVSRDIKIAIEFDKAVRKLDDSPVVNDDLATMITFKETNASGADVTFTATINAEKDSISVVPTATLSEGQTYFIEIAAQLESNLDAVIALSNTSFTTIDDEAPVATFNPLNAATDIANTSNIVITLDEAIVNTDASAIDDANIDVLITLKETDAAGANITFDATIDVDKKIITIDPAADFSTNQVVYVALASVEDASGNESVAQTATFTTIKSNDATISSTEYTVENTDETITDIPFVTTLATFESNLTPATGASFETYEADGTTVATDLATGYKVIVTAEDASTKTYVITVDAEIARELFFSEYIEGSSYNKALEIYNPTNASVDLTTYIIRGTSNEATDWEFDYEFPVGSSVAANDVFVIVDDAAVQGMLDVADWIDDGYTAGFNGNDARGLFKIVGNDTTLIDIVGDFNNPDGVDYDVAGITAGLANHTILRKSNITEGNINWTASAGTNADNSEWLVQEIDNASNLGLFTVLSSEAYVTSAVYTVNGTDNTITNIPFTATLAEFEANLTPAANATFKTYQADGTTIATDLATGYKVIVTAENGTTTKIYTITVNTTESDDATVTSTVYTVNSTDWTITNVPNATTLAAFEGNLTPATSATFETYNADGTTAATDLATGYKVIVTAEDDSKNTYTITLDEAATAILFFSEYVEGTAGDDRAFEIYNPTDVSVNLSGFTVKQSHNGDGWGIDGGVVVIDYVLPLSGTIAAGDVYVVYNSGAASEISSVGDLALSYGVGDGSKNTSFTGNDALGLFRDDVLIDVIGVELATTEAGPWDVAGTTGASQDHTLIRKLGTTTGNTDWAASAGTSAANSEWIVADVDNITNLGSPTEAPTNAAPVISGFEMSPVNPTSNDDVVVKATITDDATAADALTVGLFYGSADGSETTSVTFTQVGTTDVFEGTIPASDTNVFYKITANDGELDATDYTGNYSVTVVNGISNPDGIVTMNIFPNPSNGLFTLEMNASKAGTFKVEIINIQGQIIYSNEIHQNGFYKDQIDITKENSGVYYIRVNDGNSTKVSKFMIQ
jgi:hypothetical protein